MYNPFKLDGKTILVTGASSGIGRAVAIECSKMGANVIITGRDFQRLEQTYEQLDPKKNNLQIVADLTNVIDVDRIATSIPKIDGLVNNAGVTKVKLVKSIKLRELQDILNVNTIAPIHLTQLLVKMEKFNNNSSIVFTSSLSGIFCVHYGESMYAASKAAVYGFSKAAALDLSTKNIRVNCVNPGVVETSIFDGVLTKLELEEKKKFFPLNRFGQPIDVALAIIFFLSDASSWITGADLKIDGGYSLK
jgi:NAD(P)-dependent dehydrogenase (short-subunit alcohol dehydrogenase family)